MMSQLSDLELGTLPEILDALSQFAVKAGHEIMAQRAGGVAVERKADASPVTAADKAAEDIILDGLSNQFPTIPVLAEEAASSGLIPDLGSTFFLVDPLDGTKEFISDSGEFTVNIALVENTQSILGVVYAPALGKLYRGAIGVGAEKIIVTPHGCLEDPVSIAARVPDQAHITAIASRSHRSAATDSFLDEIGAAEVVSAGSSLKFCLLAEGLADIYPRFGRTMEWDTGAGQAVLEAAGGKVVEHPGGNHLRYGKEARAYDNPHFIAYGRRNPSGA